MSKGPESDDASARSRELEIACDFAGAGREALRAGDAPRALRMAALAKDSELTALAIAAVVADPRAQPETLAEDLAARGHAREAGELFSTVGLHTKAGQAFAAAHLPRRSADELERVGAVVEAARVLEGALRAQPSDLATKLHLARLLGRHGRPQAAVKLLQELPRDRDEGRQALPILARLLRELGYPDAAEEVERDLRALGMEEGDDDVGPAPVAPPPEPSAAGVILGRFEVVREVAATAHARVVEAVDRLTDRRVAVKLLAPTLRGAGRDALVRFEREARALSQARHAAIVTLVEYFPDRPAIALEWMSGGSLAELMDAEPIAAARAVEITGAILGALGHAHRLGILHRDVKPTNVLFDAIGSPKLSDFGAAHLSDLSTTATAGAIGTFAYMAPEQRLGRPATVASDVFAAGALLYEMLTGVTAEPCPHGVTEPLVSRLHPHLTPAHDRVVRGLLAEDPRDRPTDAFEARAALEALAWPPEPLARADTPPPSGERGRTSAPPSDGERLSPAVTLGDGRDAGQLRYDRWLGRNVLVVPLDEASMAAARACARGAHPALPVVLRVVPTEAQIWVACPLGRCLEDAPRPLREHEVERLEAAVRALEEVDGAHGAIDAAHVYDCDGELSLAFPRHRPEVPTPAEDARALRALVRTLNVAGVEP